MNKPIKIDEDTLKNVLSCRRCGVMVLELHTCPFGEEIHGDDELCNCCEECEHQCAMDI